MIPCSKAFVQNYKLPKERSFRATATDRAWQRGGAYVLHTQHPKQGVVPAVCSDSVVTYVLPMLLLLMNTGLCDDSNF